MFSIFQSFYSASIRGCAKLSMSGAYSKPQSPQALEGFKKRKTKQTNEREKRGNYGKLENPAILFVQHIFPCSAFTYIFFLYLLFNILSKSGTTEAACKSFLLSTCTTEHPATQVPKTKQQHKVTEG